MRVNGVIESRVDSYYYGMCVLHSLSKAHNLCVSWS